MDDIANMSALAATELLADMKTRYEADQAADRAAATAKAEREARAIDDRVSRISHDEATARIAKYMADDGFTKRWLAGDAQAVAEMHALHRAKSEGVSSAQSLLDGSAAKTAPNAGQLGAIPVRDQIAMIESFRNEGLGDNEISHVFAMKSVSQAERAAAQRAKTQMLANPLWVKALFDKDPGALRDLRRVSFILASPIAEGA